MHEFTSSGLLHSLEGIDRISTMTMLIATYNDSSSPLDFEEEWVQTMKSGGCNFEAP